MDELLSYYSIENGYENKELLEDHIRFALTKIDNLENSRINKIAKSIDVNIEFKNMVRLAVIFHDVGKAFVRWKRDKYMSFRGHEFVSAVIMDKFARELCLEYGTTCTFAVLYHHHAMNYESRKNIKISRYNKYMADKLEEVLGKFLDDKERNVLSKVFNNLERSLTTSYLNIVEHNIFKRTSGIEYSKIRKISYLVLDALIAADYLSASKRDEGKKTNFYKTIEEFYNLYLIPMDNNT